MPQILGAQFRDRAAVTTAAHAERPADLHAAIADEVAHPHRDFDRSARHSTEVDYVQFPDELKRELAKAGIDIGHPPAWRKRSSRTPDQPRARHPGQPQRLPGASPP